VVGVSDNGDVHQDGGGSAPAAPASLVCEFDDITLLMEREIEV
jgi:hypothetical protein